ncbi:hypothetical protein DFS34DRAFT_630434 [Phlyctochytrium arcticum]|nr:hypothetical protein DFS34DRAFT_630434 [Phlyctochytrium arcticum]
MTDVMGVNIRSLSSSPELVSLIISYLTEGVIWSVDIAQYVALRRGIDIVWAHETARRMEERLQEAQAVLALNQPGYIFQSLPTADYHHILIRGSATVNNPCFTSRLQTTHFAHWSRYLSDHFCGDVVSHLFWTHCQTLERNRSRKKQPKRPSQWLGNKTVVIGQSVLDECRITFSGADDPRSVFALCSHDQLQQTFQIWKDVEVYQQDQEMEDYEYALILTKTDKNEYVKLANEALFFGLRKDMIPSSVPPQAHVWTLCTRKGPKSEAAVFYYPEEDRYWA